MSNEHSPFFGFRFFPSDALILAAGGIITWLLWRQGFPLWWMVPCVVGHFFLFCNVFRVRRSYELAWAALFLVNVGWWLNQGSLDWAASVFCQLPVTAAVLAAELCSPRYHGIFARRINRRLDAYLESRKR